ncbi:hypothetical protein BH09MYX1_BH09MYX1_06940 [soil metagenome]
MKPWTTMMLLFGATGLAALACGGAEPATPKMPDTTSSASAAPSDAPSASASATPKPALKGTVVSFARSATSGTVDKIGDKDGAFKPDGVKDVVFDLEYDGAPATALFVMTTDAEGNLTSEFDADTLIGEQTIPPEIAGIVNQGKTTYGLGVYEADKLLNGKDGALAAPLTEGRHKVALHISSKSFPKAPVRVFVLLGDGTLVKGPMVAPAK